MIFVRKKCGNVRLLLLSCGFAPLHRPAFSMFHSHVFSLGILHIFNRCKVSPSLKCRLGCLTREQYFYVKSVWIWDCCRYHVVLFCSRFWSQDLRDSQQVQDFALSKMSLWVSRAWKIFLREKCLDMRLFLISCSFVPLNRLAFSDVPQTRFQSRDLAHSQQVQSFALFKIS